MQLRRPPPERRRGPEIPVFERGEERRRLFRAVERQRLFTQADVARGDALVVAAELVDRELPARTLMLDDRLDDRERAGLEPGAVVFKRAGERRRAGETVRREEPADLELRIDRRLDAAEQLQRVAIVDERDAVALVAAAADPFALGRQIEPRAARPARARCRVLVASSSARSDQRSTGGRTCRRRPGRRRSRPCVRR